MKKLTFLFCILCLFSCIEVPSNIQTKAQNLERQYIVPEECYSVVDVYKNVETGFYIITIKDHEYIWIDNETDMLIHSASCPCQNKIESSLYNW